MAEVVYTRIPTPLGEMLAAAGADALTGLWFMGQKHLRQDEGRRFEPSHAVFAEARVWLEDYFAGTVPVSPPPLKPEGTPFQKAVWRALQKIPYGATMTYGEIARALGMNGPRAVGGAVGRNPISLIIPCHRVIGAKGALTGYGGGLGKKIFLLNLEKEEKEKEKEKTAPHR